MELRMQVEDDFLQSMMSVLNMRGTDVVRESLTILYWAVKERQRGRVILSANREGRDTARLVMPSLERIMATA